VRISAVAGIAVTWMGVCFALARRDLLLGPAYDIASLLLAYALLRLLLRMARRMPQGRLA